MTILFSLMPILLLIMAGYLFWFRSLLQELLTLKSTRGILLLAFCYLTLALLALCLVLMQQFDALLWLLTLVSVLSGLLAFYVSTIIKFK